jgi:two-component system, OmpR family, alkaline phosphatase synthesis response regulator PhoP
VNVGRVFTVAIVDDSAGTRAAVSSLLRESGFGVVEAADGAEALRVVETDGVDVVVLDVNMPGLNGYEVCRRLRQRYGYGIGIVFLSGSRTEPFDRAAGLNVGADDYVTKPYDAGELLARVRAVLRRVQAHNSLAPTRNPLTPRQLEVLRLLAEGTAPSEIAERLFVSPATVRKHIERILRVLRVRSRSEAVAWAFREGVADPAGVALPDRTARGA